MPSEWNHISLRDAGVTLVDCDHRTPPAVESGYPYVSIPQLRQGRIEIDDARKITAEHFEEWTRKAKPQAYDVVLSRRCNPGETAFVAPHMEFALGQNLVLLRADGTKVYPPFLRWLVRSPDWWGEVERFINVGAVFNSLKCADIPKFSLPIPGLAEQRSIAEALGALDDKIALLRETNATLEAIAQALFKSWFVDFDPVRAKAEGRDPIGMPPEVADLFPNEFEDSELGEIPKGWRVRSLDSFATYLNGLALQKYPPGSDDDFLPVIKIAQLRAGHTQGADRASSLLKSEYIVRDGDVLFSWSGSLEVEIWCGGDGALNQHLFKVTSNEVPKWFYYLATRHFLPSFRETAAHKATTMGHIQRKHLTESRLALPPAGVLATLSEYVEPVIEKRITNALQAWELGTLRDTLLPRLMSGKLRIPEAPCPTA